MKEHKTQILAALALALMLGVTVPQSVFASEGTEGDANAGISLLAEGTTSGTQNSAVSQDVAENLAKLIQHIEKSDEFADYRKYRVMIGEGLELQTWLNPKEVMSRKAYNLSDGSSLWSKIPAALQTTVEKKNTLNAIIDIRKDAVYTGEVKTQIDNIYTTIQDIVTRLTSAIQTALPDEEDLNTKSAEQLIDISKKVANYNQYVDLINALKFLDGIDPNAENLAELLKQKFTEEELMIFYNNLAEKSLVVDKDAMEGLMDWKLPDTSVKPGEDKPTISKDDQEQPKVPSTGIVGMIESGALDLGTITLIASVVIATTFGLGLIAKLYLKHKF